MKIVTKKQLQELMKQYPEGGIVFADYTPDVCHGLRPRNDGSGRQGAVPTK